MAALGATLAAEHHQPVGNLGKSAVRVSSDSRHAGRLEWRTLLQWLLVDGLTEMQALPGKPIAGRHAPFALGGSDGGGARADHNRRDPAQHARMDLID
jgi:hypothetical protein